LGGFTTFSSFSLDTITLIERGQVTVALGYIALSLLGSLAALWAGLSITRIFA
jgi:CrcB protein